MERRERRSNRGVFHPLAVAPYVVLAAGWVVVPLVLNAFILKGLERVVPFAVEAKIEKSSWGRFILKSVRFKAKDFDLEVDRLQVHYSLRRLLLLQKLNLNFFGAGIQVHLADDFLKANPLGSFSMKDWQRLRFDFFLTRLDWRPGYHLHFPWGMVRSKDLSFLWKGDVTKGKRLDLAVKCLIKPELLEKLSPFVSENLFSSWEGPYQRVDFRAEGDWLQPNFSFQSDLVKFELKGAG